MPWTGADMVPYTNQRSKPGRRHNSKGNNSILVKGVDSWISACQEIGVSSGSTLDPVDRAKRLTKTLVLTKLTDQDQSFLHQDMSTSEYVVRH